MFRTILNFHADTIRDITDRLASRNTLRTEPFFVGLHNHAALDGLSLLDRFVALFQGRLVTRNEVMGLGERLFRSEYDRAVRRAQTNTRKVTAEDGTTFLVTVATEGINKVHGAEHTMVLCLRFNEDAEPHDQLQISLRSLDDVPVLHRSQAIGGGGDRNVAGGRIKIDLPWSW